MYLQHFPIMVQYSLVRCITTDTATQTHNAMQVIQVASYKSIVVRLGGIRKGGNYNKLKIL